MIILVSILIGLFAGAGGATFSIFAVAQTYATIQVMGTPQTFRGVLREHGLEMFACWMVLGALVGAAIGGAALTDGL